MSDCKKCYAEVVSKARNPSDTYCGHYDVSDRLGLTVVAEFNDPHASYSFDDFIIWQDNETGFLYYGADSGCSCPSPYENVYSLADLTRITKTGDGWKNFRKVFATYCAGPGYHEGRYVEQQVEEDTIGKVWKLLIKRKDTLVYVEGDGEEN